MKTDGGAIIHGGRGPRALFLHGAALGRNAFAQSLIGDADWPLEVVAVETLAVWRRRAFAEQVDDVDAQLETFSVAIGHGYEAWLLMAASQQRAERGARHPFLMLINPVLGTSQHLNGSFVGYRAPRSSRVRAAFGLDRGEEGSRELVERTAYVFGDNDRFSAERDWDYLRGLGSRVELIRGWHARNRREVGTALREVLAEHARELAGAVDTRRSPSRSAPTAPFAEQVL